ncbi:MAG TPA: selenite/tellurite reduction operon c-type cytochrome lipoprotein ExtS [Desulfobacterales bacterium]|nr:selenite/tellurite reduction operon c-type cytochrome lipoprotein ExtS [Desulfobacterales bacterium]
MGLRLSILTVFLGLVWTTGPHFYNGRTTGCLQCHSSHHEGWGTCVDCHRGDPRTQRIQIAHHRLVPGEYACFTLPENPVVETGQRLIEMSGCRRCHQTGQQGNGLASNLDDSVDKKIPEALADAIKQPAAFMPDFNFQGTDVTHLVNAILASSAVYASKSDALGQVIHFEADKEDRDNIFNRSCGGCHRMLTQRIGGIGKGDMGPNLSGIFSDFYFQTFQGSISWDSTGLEKWLKNPRDIRTNAQMPPVNQKKDELRHLITIMSS